METSATIQVFEYGWLCVGEKYGEKNVEFTDLHFLRLQQYLTVNKKCNYYSIYYNRIKFCNYVGVIKIGNLTIEVLPKTENHKASESVWQLVLIDMLAISLNVNARTSTYANINVRHFTVLETYLQYFITEVEGILHQGLVKKYRKTCDNQNSLKGKLLVHQNITKNIVHAERFYVEHQIYDRDNLYNQILLKTLNCIRNLQVSMSTSRSCERLLIEFPECNQLNINPNLFKNITYDRKTLRYKQAIELARIILMNFHPDMRGGNDNTIAIMFDMNRLWESYVFAMLLKYNSESGNIYNILSQDSAPYWQHPENWNYHLKPDILVTNTITKEVVVIDTKWKYNRETSIEDVRQLYAYGHYFKANRRYLLYPDNLGKESFRISDGYFYNPTGKTLDNTQICGVAYLDLIKEGRLNTEVGKKILTSIF